MLTYSQLLYEQATISLELDGMEDSALVEEVSVILINFENEDVDNAMNRYFKNGKLSPIDRKCLEDFYVLAYRELLWKE